MNERYVLIGDIPYQSRLYFSDIADCKSADTLHEWLGTVTNAVDDIGVQIEVFNESGGNKSDAWYAKATKAIIAYRQAQKRIRRRIREVEASVGKVAA